MASREECGASARPAGGGGAVEQGVGVPQDAAGHPRARPARADITHRFRRTIVDDQRVCRVRGGTHLRAGARALPTAGREPTAPPSTGWTVPVLFRAGRVTDGA